MNEKLQESVQYLRYCNIIENEAFSLYDTLSKKLNQPESSFILGLAYDSLKNAKVIQGILDFFDLAELENKNGKKNLTELATETATLTRKISRINNLDCLVSCEMLKESINLEDLLTEVYTNFVQSSSPKTIDDELSKLVIVNFENFKKVFENFIEEKARHRGILIEIVYSFESKEAETQRQITSPVVKYRNPDAWIRESTIHSFSNIQVNGSTES